MSSPFSRPVRMRGLFLGLLFLLLPCLGCGGATALDPNAPPGRNLFIGELCTSCHGFERKGTWMGPPLTQLAEHWDRKTLARFIREPSVFVKNDQRIRNLAKRFQVNMTGNTRLNEGDRLVLADWLLTPPVAPTPATE